MTEPGRLNLQRRYSAEEEEWGGALNGNVNFKFCRVKLICAASSLSACTRLPRMNYAGPL